MLFAPKGTPPDIVQRMNQVVTDALNRPDIMRKLQDNDLNPLPEPPAETARQLHEDAAKWAGVVHKIHLRVD